MPPSVMDEFLDVQLAPTRTTRRRYDPVGQALEVLYRAPNLSYGDELLVDTSAYGVPGEHWCEVVGLALGDAAVYPYKVEVPERGTGQYRAREVLGWRRPVKLHRLIRTVQRVGVL
jgi:hypothetical protein